MPGLLKFCLEATRSEDAVGDPDRVLDTMDDERKKWLEEALSGMSVDVIEQLTNGMKMLLSDTADLEQKEETLDCLEDWLGNIDNANNFHKIGGFSSLRHCLNSNHPSLRTGAAHLVAELSQNNDYCQSKFTEDGFVSLLLEQLDQDVDEVCRVKAMYAISCICREYAPGLTAFCNLDGWSVVLRAIQSNLPKLRTKACFFLAAIAKVNDTIVEDLSAMGLVQQLCSVLNEPVDLTHEQVLHAILTLVLKSGTAREDASGRELGLDRILKEKMTEMSGLEEYQESVEYCRQLLELCCTREEESADR
jgi:hsp70-interacting protein